MKSKNATSTDRGTDKPGATPRLVKYDNGDWWLIEDDYPQLAFTKGSALAIALEARLSETEPELGRDEFDEYPLAEASFKEPFEPDATLRAEVTKAIDAHPLIAGLLYDIDLMPEQIKDERRYNYMLAVIDHMLHALRKGARRSVVLGKQPAESASRCVGAEPTPIGIFWQTVGDGKWHFNEGVFDPWDIHDNGRPMHIALLGKQVRRGERPGQDNKEKK